MSLQPNERGVSVKRILLLPNPDKPAALKLCGSLIDLLTEQGFETVLEETIALTLRAMNAPNPDRTCEERSDRDLWNGIDLALVLGGDGSMLNAARRIYPRQIPLLGINLGQLGFLTTVESNTIQETICALRRHDFQIEERVMLEAEVIRENAVSAKLPELIGLNELVVAKSVFTRMIRLKTWIDDEYFTTYPADGLIISTATGSTAYSLSAGGPILDPRLSAVLMTPICAHSLYARPVILCPNAQIKVQIESVHNDITLTADGQSDIRLQPGDIVRFGVAPYVTKLLRLNRHGVFEALRSRLKEGKI